MLRYTHIIIAAFTLVSACSPESQADDILISSLSDFVLDLHNLSDHKRYLLIPGTGCASCISSAEKYLESHSGKHFDFAIVFVNVQSKKLLRLRLKKFFASDSFVVVDTESEIIYRSIYPSLASRDLDGWKIEQYHGPFFSLDSTLH